MELQALRKHGWSIRALAREFGLSRNTVRRELRSDQPREYSARAQPAALNAAQVAHIERRLAVCPGIRGSLLYFELRRDYAYAGSYPAFIRHLRAVRPPVMRDPEIRFETNPGIQTQADWAHLGRWPLGESMVELHAMVTILGCSRAPAIRFATDCTRPTSFERLLHCLDDLGGVTMEILTDRDPAFCIGATSDGSAILAPEWVDLCALLGVAPKACRPYRAKTKGKVERMVRELKESFIPWLTGQVLPLRCSLADYDRLAQTWIHELVLPRRHRTTERIVGKAWLEERSLLRAIPSRIMNAYVGEVLVPPIPILVDQQQRELGNVVEIRSLAEYEVAL
ncbi:MAG TPA: IS21 family transposase [Candidatus Dormibacteraeota bacterium]|nr:IS21 family transposase [Candidatus Dormibacteraeota bacterium]